MAMAIPLSLFREDAEDDCQSRIRCCSDERRPRRPPDDIVGRATGMNERRPTPGGIGQRTNTRTYRLASRGVNRAEHDSPQRRRCSYLADATDGHTNEGDPSPAPIPHGSVFDGDNRKLQMW